MSLPTEKTPKKTALWQLIVLIYGLAKIGKSTFCSQMEHAVFLCTECGLNHLEAYQVIIGSWQDFLTACNELAKGNHTFETVVIDTIDNLYKLCVEHICAKLGIDHPADLPFGKGFAAVNNEFFRALTKLSLLPYGLFMISHSVEKEYETRSGRYVQSVPTLPDKASQIVLNMADMILFFDLEKTTGADGQPSFRRVIRTKPHVNYMAGDRTGRLPEVLDLDYHAFREAFQAGAASETAPLSTNQSMTTTNKNMNEKGEKI